MVLYFTGRYRSCAKHDTGGSWPLTRSASMSLLTRYGPRSADYEVRKTQHPLQRLCGGNDLGLILQREFSPRQSCASLLLAESERQATPVRVSGPLRYGRAAASGVCTVATRHTGRMHDGHRPRGCDDGLTAEYVALHSQHLHGSGKFGIVMIPAALAYHGSL